MRFKTVPEGPELKLSRDFLRSSVIGKTIVDAKVYPSGRYRKKDPEGFSLIRVFEPSVASINVHGKFMWWTFLPFVTANGIPDKLQSYYMFCTYGMSGQWSFQETKHTAFSFKFKDDSCIYFNDPRHFGTLKFSYGKIGLDVLENKLNTLGPDMLSNPPSLESFVQILSKHSKKTLPEVLMNQNIIAGVGNYIKAESLYKAGLSPHRTVASLSSDDFERLYNGIREVMESAYQLGGATIQTYRNPDGKAGDATKNFQVYKHKNDPKGNSVIRSETKDKRTTWWCPALQV